MKRTSNDLSLSLSSNELQVTDLVLSAMYEFGNKCSYECLPKKKKKTSTLIKNKV